MGLALTTGSILQFKGKQAYLAFGQFAWIRGGGSFMKSGVNVYLASFWV